jgi:predicted RNA-binding protein associated with RNAse of E/G family
MIGSGGIPMQEIHLYRKRFIPNEMIHLKDDQIIVQKENLIITKWNTLKTREDISHGTSAYFMDNGYKISKIYDKSNQIVYWYCDIIETQFDKETASYIFIDLLIDVLIYEDGTVKVVDLGEVGDMLDSDVIDKKLASKALHIAENLLNKIYSGHFSEFQQIINEAESLH